MVTSFLGNPRLIVMVLLVTVMAGGYALYALPRMEDPELTPRAGFLITPFPGADASRVEALVTEKLEQELIQIKEVKNLLSTSRAGVSFIVVELNDDTNRDQANIAWSKVRDRADNARLQFPAGAGKPRFEKLEIRAFALIVGLRWDAESEPMYSILRRRLKDLQTRIEALQDTERTELFADPGEEVLVTISPETAAALDLSPRDVSQLIAQSDAKVSAGHLRSANEDVLLQVSGELDTITRISSIPVRVSDTGGEVLLGDIAEIKKSIPTPPASQALLSNQPAVVMGALVRSNVRIDAWNQKVQAILDDFRRDLPTGIAMEVVLEQNQYVQDRMQGLLRVMVQSVLAVLAVTVLFMGFRASLVIGLTIPMTCLSAFAVMQWCGIPIHQMSVTGLIVSMGLMIDASIITVDEIARRIAAGASRAAAVAGGTRFMMLPLLNAGLTSVLSFAPIAMMPGPAGEFVGAIGTVTIIAVVLSVAWSLTVIAALAGRWLPGPNTANSFFSRGIHLGWLTRFYGRMLETVYRLPLLGVVGCVTLSVAGFWGLASLPEQFFPTADRPQFHIEMTLPVTASIEETKRLAQLSREKLMEDPDIQRVSWFLGDSAPVFYYNIIPDRRDTPSFGQAIVDITPGIDPAPVVARVQTLLDNLAPQASCLVRQLEQGPAFAAPIEVRLFGRSPERLRELGDQVRLVLSGTPGVIATRSDSAETRPKVLFSVDHQQARLAGLEPLDIASELFARTDGISGGSLLEGSEELPVKVRVADDRRSDLNRIASISILPPASRTLSAGTLQQASYQSVPLSAIAKLDLSHVEAGINRKNGERMNEVQAFLEVGALPVEVQNDFAQRLKQANFDLPEGYRLEYGGADERRDSAITNLVANTAVWATCMVTVLVLSYNSFRMAAIILAVGFMSVGYALGSLWFFGFPWGFMALVGAMGMIGAAVNDSIIVLMVLRKLPADRAFDIAAIREKVVENSRHNFATTVTTVVGFAPLFFAGGQFWPPVALTIAGGVFWATALSLFFVPCAYLLMPGGRNTSSQTQPVVALG